MIEMELLNEVIEIAVAAGDEILDVYDSEQAIAVSLKADDSPITAADRRAHSLIAGRLGELTPQIPLLSEESDAIDFSVRNSWTTYWLIDPLDGTKEFINRNGEFTVNIALIENGHAVAGVVYVPVSRICYFGGVGLGAYKRCGNEAQPQPIRCRPMSVENAVSVVASRRHGGEELKTVIRHIEEQLGEVALLSMGSSLKMCLLAEGVADIYPRLGPTSEWDTAAAHAVLSAAGGSIVDLHFETLRYNSRETLLNPSFIALADTRYPWRSLLDKAL